LEQSRAKEGTYRIRSLTLKMKVRKGISKQRGMREVKVRIGVSRIQRPGAGQKYRLFVEWGTGKWTAKNPLDNCPSFSYNLLI